MNKNSGFLQDDNGNLSSTRLAFLLWVVGVLLIWGVSSLKSGDLKNIPDSVTTIIGVLMGGKVMQKFGERSNSAVTNTTPLMVQAPPAGHNPNIDPIVVPTATPTVPTANPQAFG